MKKYLTAIVAASLTFVSGEASGLSLTGDVRMIHSPSSVQDGERTNNRKALLFTEQANAALKENLSVEAYLPGKYNGTAQTTRRRTLAAGRTVNSYFLHANTRAQKNGRVRGSIGFDEKILGVIFGDFSESNALIGAPGTAYESTTGHGLEEGDWIRISKDRKRLDFDFSVTNITDQVRIITTSLNKSTNTDRIKNAMPEPLTPTLLAMGLAGLVMRRRRMARPEF